MRKMIACGLLLIPFSLRCAQAIGNWVDDAGWPACIIYLDKGNYFSIETHRTEYNKIVAPFRIRFSTRPSSLVDLCLRKVSYDIFKKKCNQDEFDKFLIRKLCTKPIQKKRFVDDWDDIFGYLDSIGMTLCRQYSDEQVYTIIKEIGKQLGEQIMRNIPQNDEAFLASEEGMQQIQVLQNFFAQWLVKTHNFFALDYTKTLQEQAAHEKLWVARKELFELLEGIK